MRPLGLLAAAVLLAGCAASPHNAEQKAPAARADDTASASLTERATPAAGVAHKPSAYRSEGVVNPSLVDIYLDCGDSALGAYTLEIRFDPSVIKVGEILPAPHGFPGAPMVHPASYSSGVTRIVGLHTGSLLRGRVHVARIRFLPVRQGSTALSVSVLGLYGTNGRPIPGAAVLSRHRIVVLPAR